MRSRRPGKYPAFCQGLVPTYTLKQTYVNLFSNILTLSTLARKLNFSTTNILLFLNFYFYFYKIFISLISIKVR